MVSVPNNWGLGQAVFHRLLLAGGMEAAFEVYAFAVTLERGSSSPGLVCPSLVCPCRPPTHSPDHLSIPQTDHLTTPTTLFPSVAVELLLTAKQKLGNFTSFNVLPMKLYQFGHWVIKITNFKQGSTFPTLLHWLNFSPTLLLPLGLTAAPWGFATLH